MENKADIYQPIRSTVVGPPPLVLGVIMTISQNYMGGGVPQHDVRSENYVLLSALPKELQERVRTAVQAIISGM